MSYQYINQNLITGYYPNQQPYLIQQNQTPVNYYMQNPYQASFYNNSNQLYPYNIPQFSPNINSNYFSLGKIKGPDGSDVHLFQLANGQKVAIMPKKDQATIVKTFLNGGSFNEIDKNRGISHCIEHCLFKGSSKLKDGDVFKLTGAMGASTNASTDTGQTDYYITAPYMDEANLEQTIKIQGDMLSTPLFKQEDVKNEILGAVCTEISMMGDEPLKLATDRVIRNLYQIKSESEDMVAGSIETVSALNSEDLRNYYQNHYTPENLYTVVVGDVDVDKTIKLISENFNIANTQTQKRSVLELNPIKVPKREDLISPKAKQTYIITAFNAPKGTDIDSTIVSNLIGLYLSSCSTSDIKNGLEKMHGSYIQDNSKVGLEPTNFRATVGYIDLKQPNEQEALDLFYQTIQKIQQNGLSDDDLTAMKNKMLKGFEIGMSSSSTICDVIGKAFLAGDINTINRYKAAIQSITNDDIKRVAKEYYDLNKVSIVVVHPDTQNSDEINSRYENSKYSLQNVQKQTNGIVSFSGTKKISTDDIEVKDLENNTRIAFNKSKNDICGISWRLDTPPIPPKNPNIPDVLNYIFTKGTDYKSQNELERFQELNGIDTTIITNGRKIEIAGSCMAPNLDSYLSLVKEMMYAPKFTQNDFDEAKEHIRKALESMDKESTSNLLDNLFPDYFPTKNKRLAALESLTLDDVKEFYNELIKNSSSYMVATIPEENYESYKAKVINSQDPNGIRFQKASPAFKPMFQQNMISTVICDYDNKNQADIVKTYTFPLSGNIEDEAKFEILNEILGGSANARLFEDLREKQNLAYSTYSSVNSFENTGMISLMISTMTDNPATGTPSYDNVKKSLEGFNYHTDKLCKEPVSKEELEAAKNKLRQQLYGTFQNPLSKTDFLAMNIREPYGIQRIDRYLEAIDKVTIEDIQKAANFVFKHKPTTSIVASKNTITSQLDYLKSQGEIKLIDE